MDSRWSRPGPCHEKHQLLICTAQTSAKGQEQVWPPRFWLASGQRHLPALGSSTGFVAGPEASLLHPCLLSLEACCYLRGDPGILQQHPGPHSRVSSHKFPVLANLSSPKQRLRVEVREDAEEGSSHLEDLGADDLVGAGGAAPLRPDPFPAFGPACDVKDQGKAREPSARSTSTAGPTVRRRARCALDLVLLEHHAVG